MGDATVRVREADPGANTKLIDNEKVTVGADEVYRQRVVHEEPPGQTSYYSGAAGTVNVSAGLKVMRIYAHAPTTGAATLTIAGGSLIPIPAGAVFVDDPGGAWVAPTIVFAGTDAYYVRCRT